MAQTGGNHYQGVAVWRLDEETEEVVESDSYWNEA